MNYKLGILGLLTAGLSMPAAKAEQVSVPAPPLYTITFTCAKPGCVLPTNPATFNWDGKKFSNFVVTWKKVTFDMAPQANKGFVTPSRPQCVKTLFGSQASFALITNKCPNSNWTVYPNSFKPGLPFGPSIFHFGDMEHMGQTPQEVYFDGNGAAIPNVTKMGGESGTFKCTLNGNPC